MEAPEDVGEMAAEDAPVRVELVDDDIAKILEERRPFRMVREDPRVEHVGVRQHEIRPRADGTPRVLGRVAVVGEHPHLGQALRQRLELRELVLGERLRREEIEDARSEEHTSELQSLAYLVYRLLL